MPRYLTAPSRFLVIISTFVVALVLFLASSVMAAGPEPETVDYVVRSGDSLWTIAAEIADAVGTPKVANVVVLGALVAATDAFTQEFCESTLRAVIKKKSLIDMNIEAFRRGYDFVKKA